MYIFLEATHDNEIIVKGCFSRILYSWVIWKQFGYFSFHSIDMKYLQETQMRNWCPGSLVIETERQIGPVLFHSLSEISSFKLEFYKNKMD